jgi:hypothetical protein
VAESFELSANMVRPGTGLHADQTARNVHEPPLELRPRDLQLQYNRPALVEADQVEGVLADIDADRGDGGWH